MCYVTDLQHNTCSTNGNNSQQRSSIVSCSNQSMIAVSSTNLISSSSPASSQSNIDCNPSVLHRNYSHSNESTSSPCTQSDYLAPSNLELVNRHSTSSNADITMSSYEADCGRHYGYGKSVPPLENIQSAHSIISSCPYPTSLPPHCSSTHNDSYAYICIRDNNVPQTHADDGSLLLLANCATMSMSTPRNEMRSRAPSLSLSERCAPTEPRIPSFYSQSVHPWDVQEPCSTTGDTLTPDNNHCSGIWCNQSESGIQKHQVTASNYKQHTVNGEQLSLVCWMNTSDQ